MAFHEVRFPDKIAYGASGGPTRKVEIASLASGHEERNSPWGSSRHKYNVSTGVKTYDDLHAVKAFFEARLGQLYGFRFKDFADFKSCPPLTGASNIDQVIGTSNGTTASFQLVKKYVSGAYSYTRLIQKPVSGTVLVAVNGTAKTEGVHYNVNYTLGIVTFIAGNIPAAAQQITAGFEFDVPVRFDQENLDINLSNFKMGQVDAITVIEIKLRADGSG